MIWETGSIDEADVGFYSGLIVSTAVIIGILYQVHLLRKSFLRATSTLYSAGDNLNQMYIDLGCGGRHETALLRVTRSPSLKQP